MITARDLEVVQFISTFKAATAEQIQKVFFPSLRTTNRSLLRIMRSKQFKEIKRDKFLYSRKFVYYYKNKTQVIHNLLLTEFYTLLKTHKGSLVEFEPQYPVMGYYPDAFARHRINNLEHLFFIEVQTSNSDLNIEKYERIFQKYHWEEVWGVFPKIVVISDKNIGFRSKLKVIKINTKFENWEEVLNEKVG